MLKRGAGSELHTPISLILRLGQNDDGDWRLFFDIYAPVIYRLARRFRLTHHDANDVVSIVMRSIHRRISRGFKPEAHRGRFRGYLARSVQRAALRVRDKQGSVLSGTTAVDKSPDFREQSISQISKLERIERLRYCLDRLRQSPRIRRRDVEIFERVALGGEAPERIAKSVGVSVSRIYGIKREMLILLRKKMKQLDIELGEV